MGKIYIGSTNPAKVKSTQKAFGLVFPEKDFEFIGVPAASDVSHQPFGEDETLRGALNRVQQINQKYPDAAYWIGIEGGLDKIHDVMYAFAWIVVMNNQRSSKARTATFEIPGPLESLIELGYELGDADDQLFQRSNSKQNDGTVGRLTSGIIDRIEYYKHAMILALIPFREYELFK